MKKMLVLLVILGLIATMAIGCTGGGTAPEEPAEEPAEQPAEQPAEEPAEKIVLQFGHTVATEHPIHKSALYMAERLAEESDGRIELQIMPAGQLGGEKENLEGLMAGTHMFHMGTQAPLSNWVDGFMVFDLPYLVSSHEEADEMVEKPFATELLASLPDVGLYGLGWCENGFRHFTNSARPITSLSDIDGLSFRVMENRLMIDTLSEWGTDPQTLPFPEVYSALQQGVVDGQENPLTIIADNMLMEVQDYVTLSSHFYSPFILYASKPIMDSLPEDIQEIIWEVGAEVAAYQKQLNRDQEAGALERIKEFSEVNELSAEAKQEFRDAAQPIYEKYRDVIGADIYDLVVE